MENNIIDFTKVKQLRQIYQITEEDIFNLILIYVWFNKEEWEYMPEVDLNLVMESIEKYRNMDMFSEIYSNLDFETEQNGNSCLMTWRNRLKDENVIINNPSKKSEIIILASDEYFEKMKSEYNSKFNEKIYPKLAKLMFFIYMDLKNGIGNWELLFEDEVIEVPGYPSVVTGEFISQEKDVKVMKKVKKMAVERLKNLYK